MHLNISRYQSMKTNRYLSFPSIFNACALNSEIAVAFQLPTFLSKNNALHRPRISSSALNIDADISEWRDIMFDPPIVLASLERKITKKVP